MGRKSDNLLVNTTKRTVKSASLFLMEQTVLRIAGQMKGQSMPKLTKDDIKALRECDDASVYFKNEKSYISAIKRWNGESIFEGDQRRTIECETRIGISGRFENGRIKSLKSAHEFINSCQFNPIWTTLVGLMKVGDELVLNWEADYFTTQNLSEAKLHGDAVLLIIIRKDKKMHFYLDASVCPDGSARMCQVVSEPR